MVVVVNVARLVLLRFYRHDAEAGARTIFWQRCFTASVLGSSLVWCITGMLLFRHGSVQEIGFAVFILGGMSAAGVATLGAIRSAYASFSLPIIASLIVGLVLRGDVVSLSMAGLTACFELAMLGAARRVSELYQRSIVLRLNNEALVTSLTKNAEHLEQIAFHDTLTGLPNRFGINDRLDQFMAQNLRRKTTIAVCYLDLDGFKSVNDQFGHPVGDKVLVEAASRLSSCVRAGDTVIRLGGDEFVLFVGGLADEDECVSILERLLEKMSATYAINGVELNGISASIGVTLFPSDRADPDTLLRHADHALYVAKQAGKNRYQWFDAQLQQRMAARQTTRSELAGALDLRQLCLVYQPIVDCRLGQCVAVEALIRWQHPSRGWLMPSEFLSLIRDTERARTVGAWVLRDVLASAARWRQEGVRVRVSVNVFTRQLLQEDFAAVLADALSRHPELAPASLRLELLGTTPVDQLPAVHAAIKACLALGVSFSLDDFGSGSTLAHLRDLPVTEIKIDQSVVCQMLERTDDLATVESIIALGQAFGRSVVAEGVESVDHLTRLLALGCPVMQGYALARPMPAELIPLWLREFAPDPAWQKAAPGS